MIQNTIKIGLTAAMLLGLPFFPFSGKADEADADKVAASLTTGNNEHHGNADTNGLICQLSILDWPLQNGQQPPVCAVNVFNTTTNDIPSQHSISNLYWIAFPTNYLKVELSGSNGIPVEKTPYGKQFTASASTQQMRELFSRLDRRMRVRQCFAWFGPNSRVTFNSFSIPELFEIKQPGEYTLKVKMRLIRKVGAVNLDSDFETSWLPEVIAKVQIRPKRGQTITFH